MIRARPAAGSEFSLADSAMLLALAAVWGFTFLFIEVAVAALSPLWLVAGRTLAGALVLLVALRLQGSALPRGATVWGHLLFLAVPANVIPWTLVAWAQQTIPSGLTAVLYALIPLTTFAVAALAGLERFTLLRMAGLLVALAGTAIAVLGDLGSPERAAAVGAVLAATAFLAVGAVYTKRYVSSSVRPLPMASAQIGIAFCVSVVAAAVVGPTPTLADLTPPVVGAVLALGALGTGLAFLLYYSLIDSVGSTNATLVTYLIPVIGLLAGWLVLGEELPGTVFAGAAVVVAGIWIGQRDRPRGAPRR